MKRIPAAIWWIGAIYFGIVGVSEWSYNSSGSEQSSGVFASLTTNLASLPSFGSLASSEGWPGVPLFDLIPSAILFYMAIRYE